MVVGIITIGDELLIGQVVDSNSARIAQVLAEISIDVNRKWTVGDDLQSIHQVLVEATSCCNILITTGGLGPTKDDITKKALADFFGASLVFSEENYEHLVNMLSIRNVAVHDVHKVQCYVPSNAVLLKNEVGTAMGMWMEHGGNTIISLPGVPDEMNYILQHEVLPKLKLLSSDTIVMHNTLMTVGTGETDIANRIEPLLSTMPQYISLAYLPSIAQVKLRLTGRHSNQEELKGTMIQYVEIIKRELKDIIFGEGDTNLALEIGQQLQKKSWKIAAIESCTGGAISAKFTANPGSSAYYKGGIVSYATEMKEMLLGIPKEAIQKFGVVSEEVVRAMVINGSRMLKVECAVATTGIAGPEGATESNPVGTVFIACGNSDHQSIRKLRLGKNRQRTIEAASVLAMDLVRKWIEIDDFTKVI